MYHTQQGTDVYTYLMKETPSIPRKNIPHETPEAVEKGEMEVEVKYLVQSLPEEIEELIRSKTCDYRVIEQGYIRSVGKSAKKARLRVRKSYHPDHGEEYRFTDKKGISGNEVARFEHEIPVESKEEFDALWKLTEGHRVHKTRYYIPYTHPEIEAELTIELDIFHDALEGLMLAEIEFKTEGKDTIEAEKKAALVRAKPPKWFGEDVTGEKQWKNSTLAAKGLPK